MPDPGGWPVCDTPSFQEGGFKFDFHSCRTRDLIWIISNGFLSIGCIES